MGLPAWLTTSTLQINSDDEEYEISEDDEDDEGGEEGRHRPAEGADDSSSEGQQESDGDTFVLAGVRSHGLDEK